MCVTFLSEVRNQLIPISLEFFLSKFYSQDSFCDIGNAISGLWCDRTLFLITFKMNRGHYILCEKTPERADAF